MNNFTPFERHYQEKITGISTYIYKLIYRLLKNRKSARKSRKRRKSELMTLRDEIKLLRQENESLRNKLKQQASAAPSSGNTVSLMKSNDGPRQKDQVPLYPIARKQHTVLIQNNTNQPELHAQEHIQSKHEEIKQPSRPVLNTPPIHPHFSSDDVSTSFRQRASQLLMGAI